MYIKQLLGRSGSHGHKVSREDEAGMHVLPVKLEERVASLDSCIRQGRRSSLEVLTIQNIPEAGEHLDSLCFR